MDNLQAAILLRMSLSTTLLLLMPFAILEIAYLSAWTQTSISPGARLSQR